MAPTAVSPAPAINRISGGAVIMAGSGMCTGGRIRHHLRHNLWRPEASIVFVGFAAQELLAWHRGIASVETTFLVHGEEPVMVALASMSLAAARRLPRSRPRRGWVEPADVINTRDLAQIRRLLRR